ncbi:serine/threonine-protein kinase [Hyalangium minutum]|uniref:Serine/threonine protein kinase PrkC, regulator of stationary phase n=1 Tax=Hyalangium minutum TaxID=394096 RepID=A0A085WGH6_9BACT|nr:serine/threonine-protein kinase [Hyalangium minutum]KFE66789.1 Serine/threonine protein kinase PrkC, regulator of stationary phase [Hyalangium minutum]
MGLQTGEQFGRYELVSHLGRGGMAEVWRARLLGEAGVTKPVLIKKVLPEYANDEAFIRMFISEARISATLSHGNIAQVYDFGRVDGDYFLAMEYVDGQPLHRFFKRAIRTGLPSFPIPIAVFIATELCRGLHYAHTRRDSNGKPLGIVHRDISPDNVIVSYEGQVKIVDFGIAKARELRGFNTEPGVVKGKYLFFSPEQAQGQEVDARSDVWSTGIVLYQLLCGRMPVSEETPHTAMIKLAQGEFPRPSALRPDLPPALDAILMKALAVDRDQRYESSHAFGDALTEFLYSTTPRFSALSLSHFIQEVFRQDLVGLGHTVQVPRSFQDQLAQWKGELTTAPMTAVALPTPAAPPSAIPPGASTSPARTGLYVGVGIGAALLGAAVTALLFLQGWEPAPSSDAPSEPPIASTTSAPEPSPQPPAPAPVETAPPAEAPEAPTERAEPIEQPEPEPSHAHASASYPVAAIRLDARQDIIPPSSEAVELTLDPSGTYRLSEPEPPPDSPPLFLWLSGPGLPARDGVGVLSQRPLQLKGVSSFKAFGLKPLPPGAQEREVLVEDVRAKTRKRVVISPSATASTDQAFELKNLDPSSSYLLTLVPLDPGAYTRGEQGGLLDKLACVRLSDTEGPTPSFRDQQFLLRAGTSLPLSGATRLLCGVIDDDPSDNAGELQIAITRTSGGPEWTSPSPYTLVIPSKSGEIKSSFEQAMRFFRNKQYDRAAIFAERCLSLAPRDADCRLLAGAIYASLPGQQDKAAQNYRLFMDLAPNHPRVSHVQRHLADLAP